MSREKEDLWNVVTAVTKENRMNSERTVAEKLSIEKWYRKRALDQFDDEGTLEIDDHAPVSLGGDPGAYVQAWVWIENPKCFACREHLEELEEIPEDGRFKCAKCREVVKTVVNTIREETEDGQEESEKKEGSSQHGEGEEKGSEE